MARVLKYKGKSALVKRSERKKARLKAMKFGLTGNKRVRVVGEVINVGVFTKELESYIPGHIKATSYIYNSEESELSRMIKMADRIAHRNQK